MADWIEDLKKVNRREMEVIELEQDVADLVATFRKDGFAPASALRTLAEKWEPF